MTDTDTKPAEAEAEVDMTVKASVDPKTQNAIDAIRAVPFEDLPTLFLEVASLAYDSDKEEDCADNLAAKNADVFDAFAEAFDDLKDNG